jgi:hypothetical protein
LPLPVGQREEGAEELEDVSEFQGEEG